MSSTRKKKKKKHYGSIHREIRWKDTEKRVFFLLDTLYLIIVIFLFL